MTETTLGRRIGQRRKMLGLSQESFGEKMGVSRQAISKWEADATIPEVDRLVEMSKIFGVSVDWLLGVEEQEKPEEPVNPFVAAFQPPEPVQETMPEPEPEPEPEPIPELRMPRRRWRPWAAAAMAGASLVLSLAAVAVSISQRDVSADAELVSLRKTLAEQAQAISDLTHRMDTVFNLNYEQRVKIYDLQNELNKLKQPTQEETPGASDALKRWELTATADLVANTASVQFSCITDEEVAGATLVIREGEEMIHTLPCTGAGGIFTLQTQLEPKNGYHYTLLLDYPDGSVQSADVTNSAASNLLSGMQLGVGGVLKKQDNYNLTTERFWAAYDSVVLSRPKLDTTGRTYKLKDLALRYVCNGHSAAGVDLMALLPEDVLSAKILEFQIPMQVFDLPSCQEGDTHQLILEGHAVSADVTLSIYEPLSTWIVQGERLVPVADDTQ